MDQASLVRGSAGSTIAILHNLADRGQPNLYLARVLETPTAAMPHFVLLETFPYAQADEATIGMLLNEDLWLPKQLRTPEFVRLYEAGLLYGGFGGPYRAGRDSAIPYALLEPVQGASFATLLAAANTPERIAPLDACMEIGLSVARSLAYMHSLHGADGGPLGAVYHGITPSCVFLAIDGVVRVLPPIAPWLLGTAHEGMPRSRLMFLAPELVHAQAPTPQSDLYALGAILWTALAGRQLFSRATDADTLRAVIRDNPPRLSSLRAEVPRALDELVAGLLQKDPKARPATAKDVARVFEELIRTRNAESSVVFGAERWISEANPILDQSWTTFACNSIRRDDT